MSVPYLRDAAAAGDTEKLSRFVRLHLGDGNEEVGRREIDKSWIEAAKILLKYEPVDEGMIARAMSADERETIVRAAARSVGLRVDLHGWLEDGERDRRAAQLRQGRDIRKRHRLVDLRVGGLHRHSVGPYFQSLGDLADFERDVLTHTGSRIDL
jgi:hypothetical protein